MMRLHDSPEFHFLDGFADRGLKERAYEFIRENHGTGAWNHMEGVIPFPYDESVRQGQERAHHTNLDRLPRQTNLVPNAETMAAILNGISIKLRAGLKGTIKVVPLATINLVGNLDGVEDVEKASGLTANHLTSLAIRTFEAAKAGIDGHGIFNKKTIGLRKEDDSLDRIVIPAGTSLAMHRWTGHDIQRVAEDGDIKLAEFLTRIANISDARAVSYLRNDFVVTPDGELTTGMRLAMKRRLSGVKQPS